MENASLFVFVVDGREGLVPADLEIADAVRTKGRPVIVAINKADDKRAKAGALDFYELGFEPVISLTRPRFVVLGLTPPVYVVPVFAPSVSGGLALRI